MIQKRRRNPRARGLLLITAAASLTMIACERATERPGTASAEWSDFEGSWNAAGTRRVIPLGADRTASIVHFRGTMLLTGDGRPGVGFRAEAVALVDSATGLEGRGSWMDERGDEVFSELKGEGTKENNHIVGTILGGTGRYRGLSGTFEFSWQFVIEDEDGSLQGRAVGLKGRFRPGQPKAGSTTQ